MGRGCVCRVAWQFALVAMAQRVEVVRAGGGVLRPAAFIALRSRSGRVVVDAKDPVDMARLLMAWTGLGSDVALICSFEHRRQATSWATGPLPALPEWASRTCVPEGRAAVVRIGDAPPRTSVFALLRGVGGHLAVVDDASMVVKLVNTISDLNGECALARLMPSTPDCESWLLAPRVPQWLLSSSSAASSGRAAAGEDAVISVTDDGVIVLSDDESDDDAKRNAFSKAARALPPAPTTNRTILSMGSLEDGRLLPLAFQRHPVTGLLVRGGGRAASKPVTPVNDDSSTSLLTPPRRAPSSTSVGTTVSRGRRSSRLGPARVPVPLGAPRSSTSVGCPSPAGPSVSAVTPLVYSSSSLEAAEESAGTPSSSTTPRGRRAGSSTTSLGRRRGAAPATASPPRAFTPLPLAVSAATGRPTKKLRMTAAVPYDMVRLAKSILRRDSGLFVTGGGGVGKTRLLRECVAEYRSARGGLKFGLHVVAPTGVAAAVAGGVTLHAYLRLPAGCFDESLSEEQDAERLYTGMTTATKKRLSDTAVLLVDEVSMVSSRMFTLLCYCLDHAHAKHNPERPWRMVAFGDFFQLPPVRRGDEDKFDTRGLYAFKSLFWTRLFHNNQLELKYVWRQADKQFIDMLSHLRVGNVTDDLAAFLEKRAEVYKSRVSAGGLTDLEVTHIFPHRERVKIHNRQCLSTMETINGCQRQVYTAIDYPINAQLTKEEVTRQLDTALMAPKVLEVCVGARVASCANLSDGNKDVPNGTIGTIVRFESVPTHGSNGKATKVPVVCFDAVRGPVEMVVTATDMKLQSVARDGAYASRFQIPLVLAWAVTVHRCQCLSMDAAVMDLAPCFVSGMVYVALSRVRSMEGVHVFSFDREKVQADVQVGLFYSTQRDLGYVFLDCVLPTRAV